MTTLPEDRPDWLRLYLDEYWTLEEVGEHEGITREGVRVRLKGMGIKPRSLTETNALRERRSISLRGEEIRKKFFQTRDVVETARQLGLSDALVERAVRELVPDFKVLTRVPPNQSKRYSTDELLAALREAAESAPGILSTNYYDAFVAAHPTLPDGRARPGKQTMAHRFGTWRDALLRAGLPANPPSGVLLQAWQLVHGVILDQDDEDASVPEPLLPESGSQPNATPFVPYYAANEGIEVSLRSNLVTEEYNALERAVRSHALIQNAVAAAVAAAGLQPWSPSADARPLTSPPRLAMAACSWSRSSPLRKKILNSSCESGSARSCATHTCFVCMLSG